MKIYCHIYLNKFKNLFKTEGESHDSLLLKLQQREIETIGNSNTKTKYRF